MKIISNLSPPLTTIQLIFISSLLAEALVTKSTFWSAIWLHSPSDLSGTCASPEYLFYMASSLKCRGSKFAGPFQRDNTQCRRLTESEHTSDQIPCWNKFIMGEETDCDAKRKYINQMWNYHIEPIEEHNSSTKTKLVIITKFHWLWEYILSNFLVRTSE